MTSWIHSEFNQPLAVLDLDKLDGAVVEAAFTVEVAEAKTFTENWVSKQAFFLFWHWQWSKKYFLRISCNLTLNELKFVRFHKI